jgi:asparagine synthase (glutamine-hydrolysing)
LYRGVKRLLPGHTLRWSDGEVRVEKYWDVTFSGGDGAGDDRRSEQDLIEEWTELFRTSVRLRLMADVPLGMFLSGGIDSSAIAAVMSRLVDEPIKTFSVAFNEREANELEYARMVAERFRTDHHEVIVSPEEFFDALPRLVWHEDEPLAHLASIPLYFVSRLAQRHVKVVLTGEGSDEMLAGYARYRKTVYNLALGGRYQALAPAPLRRSVAHAVAGMPAGSRVRQKLERTFLCLPADLDSLYFDNFAVFPRVMQGRLLTPETVERAGSADPYAGVRRLVAETDAVTLLNRLLYADTKTYLHELLMKQDQMSMAASIESRVPFLDHKLVEFTARLPERLKLRGWTTKYVLRRAMKGVLPEAILTRRKMGFPVPFGAWLRGRHRGVLDEYVLGERARARGIFDADFVGSLAAEHVAGVRDHSSRLWSLVNFEVWLRQFIDGEQPARARSRPRPRPPPSPTENRRV